MQNVDVVVIGGGAAGLSAAVALGRSRRSVVVVDGGPPRNAPAEGVHNLLTRDGVPPLQLVADGRAEAEHYGARVVEGRVSAVEPGFTVRLADGQALSARRVIVATGVVDVLPDIPGLRERWGRDVLHCPYCHGWEVRDRRIGVLATGDGVAHQAQLFRQLSERITVFGDGRELPGDALAGFAARGIRVVDGAVTGLRIERDRLTGVRAGETVHELDALVVGSTLRTPVDFLAPLGVQPVDHPSGVAQHMPSEHGGRTAVPGLFVAGNVTDPMAQVVAAAAQGMMAGAMANADLVTEEVAAAVAASDR